MFLKIFPVANFSLPYMVSKFTRCVVNDDGLGKFSTQKVQVFHIILSNFHTVMPVEQAGGGKTH